MIASNRLGVPPWNVWAGPLNLALAHAILHQIVHVPYDHAYTTNTYIHMHSLLQMRVCNHPAFSYANPQPQSHICIATCPRPLPLAICPYPIHLACACAENLNMLQHHQLLILTYIDIGHALILQLLGHMPIPRQRHVRACNITVRWACFMFDIHVAEM
jgi:hypothetical protein